MKMYLSKKPSAIININMLKFIIPGGNQKDPWHILLKVEKKFKSSH